MKRFFRALFAGSAASDAPRTLSRVEDLQPGDVVVFALLDLPEVSGARAEVVRRATYRYDGGDDVVEIALRTSTGEQIYLGIEDDDERALTLSRKLVRADVERVFGLEAFARVFDGDGHAGLESRAGADDPLAPWLAGHYRQIAAAVPSEYRANPRSMDPFQHYALESDDERGFVEAEVYAGGETEVALGRYLPERAIEELWPAAP